MTKYSRVSIFLALLLTSWASAQTGPELLLKPWPKGQSIEGQASGGFIADGTTTHGDDFSMNFYNTAGRFRLMPDQKADPRFGFNVTFFDIDTDGPVPANLSDTSVGFGMGVLDESGWLGGITFGVGYAAAGAFNDSNGYYYQADFLIGREIDETSSIGFVIDYDGNRTFMPDVPLPGFLYTKKIDTTLTLGAGVPLCSVLWKPDKSTTWDRQLTVDAQLILPESYNVKVDYEIIKSVGVFASVAHVAEAFKWDDLSNSSDRIIYTATMAEGGVRWSPVESVSLVGSVGYAFTQEFNVGWDSQDMDRLAKPSDEAFFRVGVEVRY